MLQRCQQAWPEALSFLVAHLFVHLFNLVNTIAQERFRGISINLINYHQSVLSETECRHGVEFHYTWHKHAVKGEVVRV